MKLADLLTADRIRIPLEAKGLEAALSELTGLLTGDEGLEEDEARDIPSGLISGEIGELSALAPDVVLAVVRTSSAKELMGAVGLTDAPLESEVEDPPPSRAVLLLVTPRRISTLRAQVIPDIIRSFRDETVRGAFLACRSARDLRGVRGLMDVALDERLLVEDALSPVSYRVYPDTPMAEVLDLITRRGLHVVPVVGESYEVLGMITAAEALKFLLQRRRRGQDEGAGSKEPVAMARDVMSRTVMCVSEDQSLLEAANLMVNRDVAQLPVVRDGELIGFLTRDTTLQRLQG
jgi:CBS domain-containing protein